MFSTATCEKRILAVRKCELSGSVSDVFVFAEKCLPKMELKKRIHLMNPNVGRNEFFKINFYKFCSMGGEILKSDKNSDFLLTSTVIRPGMI